MRVFFDTNLKNPKTGKGFFLKRLAAALSKQSVQVVVSPQDQHDISLHTVNVKRPTPAKTVVRFDGVYHDTRINFKSMNKNIQTSMRRADAVVYQSVFGKFMCDKYLGTFDGPSLVSLNGADPSFYDGVSFNKESEFSFLATSRWRPHKRLVDIVESFLLADIDNSILYIAGDVRDSGVSSALLKKFRQHESVRFLGRIDQHELAKYYRSCNASLHLCWVDCCPNSVVEAICAGCVVVSNNVGGTPEIVAPSNGIVCNLDAPYDGNPVRLYSPPEIDRKQVADALRRTTMEDIAINNDHVNIDQIATAYKSFFESII